MRTISLLLLVAAAVSAQPVIVKTSTLIDGRGQVLRNQEIVIEGGRIVRVAPARSKPTYDLSGMTVMPGWIDTHVHLGWYFNKENRLDQGGRHHRPGIRRRFGRAASADSPFGETMNQRLAPSNTAE